MGMAPRRKDKKMAGGSLSKEQVEKITKQDEDAHLPVSKPEPHERGK